MVCYTCGKPASARCIRCSRYVCTGHTVRWSREEQREKFPDIERIGPYCSECEGELKRYEEERAEHKKEMERMFPRECAFCGRGDGRPRRVHVKGKGEINSGAHSNENCHECGRRFCSDHGRVDILDTGKYRPPDSRLIYHMWVRCQDHPVRKNWFGRIVDPPDRIVDHRPYN